MGIMGKVQQMTIGPMWKDWVGEEPAGDCPECGCQCSPTCGEHPAGCIYGGFSSKTAYWMIVEGCDLYHGEQPH